MYTVGREEVPGYIPPGIPTGPLDQQAEGHTAQPWVPPSTPLHPGVPVPPYTVRSLPDSGLLGSRSQSDLGSCSWAVLLSSFLFNSVSPIRLAFPSRPRHLNERSDVVGATLGPVALGPYPMSRNVPTSIRRYVPGMLHRCATFCTFCKFLLKTVLKQGTLLLLLIPVLTMFGMLLLRSAPRAADVHHPWVTPAG